MDEAVAAGVIAGTPQAFATNTLVIATPAGNPARIKGLDDLADATFAVRVPAAPGGDATERLFALADDHQRACRARDHLDHAVRHILLHAEQPQRRAALPR